MNTLEHEFNCSISSDKLNTPKSKGHQPAKAPSQAKPSTLTIYLTHKAAKQVEQLNLLGLSLVPVALASVDDAHSQSSNW